MGFLLDITEERLRDEQIHRMAYYDALTDLPNRRLLLERLDEVLRRARNGQTRGALLFLDVDDFRIVNDSLGHASGDLVLQEAARRFLAVSTERDLVTRVGGDEFLVLREGEDSREEIESYARRLLGTFADPFADEGTLHFYSLTAGVVLFPDDGTDPGELLKKADMALHKAKAERRGDVVFYEESLNRDLLRRVDLERRLRDAVSQELLLLHYQPLFSAVSKRVVGFEALLRWNDPELGWISPGEFVPVAESSGLIFPLGEFALRRACRFARELRDGGEVHHMAVNLSTRQIQQEGFAWEVLRILEETKLPPEALEVEITETALLTSYETSLENLRVLKSHGVRVALDDFGTGYSSLTYLRTLPLDTLKIDRSFIQNMHERKENELIVWAIIQLARELGLQIVAEGVETEEQVRFTTTSCDVIQGFWFSPPLPEEDIRSFLRSLRKD
jgi:diguanylate cyclase (GGDEF)-like protein